MRTMTPEETRRAREILGLTVEQLAAELSATEQMVAAWEAGTASISRGLAKDLRWRAAVAERHAALELAGLPACDTVEQLLLNAGNKNGIDAVNAHFVSCPVCTAREEWLRANFPPPPEMPLPGWLRLVGWYHDRVQRLPNWARPALHGAAIIGLIVLFRAALMMFAAGPSLRLLAMTVGAVLLGAYLGAVGGITYYAVRGRVARFGKLAPYITGIACAIAYLIAIVIPAVLMGDRELVTDSFDIGVMLFMAVLFGLMIGVMLRGWENEEPSKPAKPTSLLRIAVAVVIGSALLGGILLYSAGTADSGPSIAELEKRVHQQPNDVEARADLGFLLEQDGRTTEAEQHLREALRIAPDYDRVNKYLARVLFAQQKYDEAAGFAARAIELMPGDPNNHQVMAYVLVGAGREEDAFPHFSEAARLEPRNAQAWLDLARVAHMLGHYADATAAYDRVNQLDSRLLNQDSAELKRWDAARRGEPYFEL